MSGSLIYAAQIAGGRRIPTFNFQAKGLVLRPEHTRVLCGCERDCGGRCAGAYGSKSATPIYCDATRPPAGWSTCVWAAGPPLAVLFDRAKTNRLYNEVVVDGDYWREHLPEAVEAVVGDARMHAAFLRRYGLTADRVPLVTLDVDDWRSPFR